MLLPFDACCMMKLKDCSTYGHFGVDKSRQYYQIHQILIDPGGNYKELIFSTRDQVSHSVNYGKSTA